jgi:hypothetical protein
MDVFHLELKRARCCDHRAHNNAGKRRQAQFLPANMYMFKNVSAFTPQLQPPGASPTREAATLTPSLCRSTAWHVSSAFAYASGRSSTPSSLACG